MMKKLLCVSYFILQIALCGCRQKDLSDVKLDASLDYTPLFKESQVPLASDSLILGPGNWVFKKVYIGKKTKPVETKFIIDEDELTYSFESLKIVSVQELSVSGRKITSMSQQEKTETLMDSENKNRCDEFALLHGRNLEWNGNTLLSEDSSGLESDLDIWVSDAMKLSGSSYGLIKTNAARTLFLVRYKWNDSDVYYFAKK
jgi:hypothetical protein